MFRAKLRKYWCDFKSEYEDVARSSLTDILEYVYRYHKDTCYPAHSKFYCSGGKGRANGGVLEASFCLEERFGYRGSVWLEKITYDGSGEEVIIFSKHDGYISPKASVVFDEFAKAAKARDERKNFGDF